AFLIFIIVLNIPFILYLNSLYLLLFNQYFYKLGFERNGVYNNFADKSVPDVTAKQLIEYFKSDSVELPDIDLFNQKEKEHLLDVKLLIDWSIDNYFFFLIVSMFCVVLLYFVDKKNFIKRVSYSLLFGGLLTIVFTIVLVISILKFDFMFTRFHLVFFPQGNWMFPSEYNLIKLFPKSFFFDGFLMFLFLSLIQSLLLLLTSSSFLIKKYGKIPVLIKKSKKYLNETNKKIIV
ncbi:hypothetical protein A3K72_01310, partial [Candidatus Woesearchaeota archaeon RBG_13_36_6]